MTFRKPLSVLVVAMCFFVATLTGVAHAFYGAKFEPADGRIYHGHQSWTSSAVMWNPGYTGWVLHQSVSEYITDVGHTPVLLMIYHRVDDAPSWIGNRVTDTALNHGHPYIPQLGLSWHSVSGGESAVANGTYDTNITALAQRCASIKPMPVFIRPGFEFGGSGAHSASQPTTFKQAFIRIYNIFQAQGASNVAFVWDNASETNYMSFYPGDEYVDWWGINLFRTSYFVASGTLARNFVVDAQAHSKPVIICESTPKEYGTDSASDWNAWFQPYFYNFIGTYPNVKAFCYINSNWSGWSGWPDCLITNNSTIFNNYKTAMNESKYIHMEEYELGALDLNVQSSPATGVSIGGNVSGITNYVTFLEPDTAVTLIAPSAFTAPGGKDYTFLRWVRNGTNQTDHVTTLAFNFTSSTTVNASYDVVQRTLSVQSTPISGAVIGGVPSGTTNYTSQTDDNSAVTLIAQAVLASQYSFIRWTLNGTPQADEAMTLTFNINTDSTAVAEYAILLRTLNVQSTPITGASISGTPAGTTNYTTSLVDYSEVTLVTPATFNDTYSFTRWTLNGVAQPEAQTTAAFVIHNETTAVAVYAAGMRRLNVQTTPETGATISGTAGGVSNYTTQVSDSSAVTLTAPATFTSGSGDYTFLRWTGQPDNQATYAFNIIADMTVTAEYELTKRMVDIHSTPITGVAITGNPAGTTNYTTTLDYGTAITLVAPSSFTGGYSFIRWMLNGAAQTGGQRTLAFTLTAATTAVAEYEIGLTILVGNRWNGAAALTTNGTPITGTHPGTTRYTASVVDGSVVTLICLPPTETYMPTTYAGGRVGSLRKWYINGVSTGGSLTKTLTYTVNADTSFDVDMNPANFAFTILSTPVTGVPVTNVRGHAGGGTTNYTTSLDNWKSDTTYYVSKVPKIFNDGTSDWEAKRWLLNGTEVPSENGTLCAFTIPFNATTLPTPLIVIEYGTPTWALNVNSTPVPGVPITGTPSGTTNYSTRLDRGSAVTLTAPASYAAGDVDYTFVRWTGQTEGVLTYAFTIEADTTAVAEYELVAAGRKGDFCGDVTTDPPDGDVDFWDLIAFIDVYGLTDGDPGWEPNGPIGDFCGDVVTDPPDSDVDFWDLVAFIDVYGT